MKLYFKGVFTVEEHLLILNRLKNKTEGSYLIYRSETTHIPKIERV